MKSHLNFEKFAKDLIFIPMLAGPSSQYDLTKFLESSNPDSIILFESRLLFIRIVEAYCSRLKLKGTNPIKVYTLFYKDSIESISYCLEMSKEKKVFEELVKEKAVIGYNLYF